MDILDRKIYIIALSNAIVKPTNTTNNNKMFKLRDFYPIDLILWKADIRGKNIKERKFIPNYVWTNMFIGSYTF